MICNFLVTVTIMVSGPTKTDTLGKIAVKHYTYNNFTSASKFVKLNTLRIKKDFVDNKYPNTIGVELFRFNDFDCDNNGGDLK